MPTIGRNGLFTLNEAIKLFVSATTIYVIIIFNRELYSWASGKTLDELLTLKSYKALVVIGTILYVIFLVGWADTVIRSYNRYRRIKQ